jgi:hypothetical protein
MKIAGRYARQFSRQSSATLRTQLQVKPMLERRLRRGVIMKKININNLELITCIVLIVYSSIFYLCNFQYYPIIKSPHGFFYTFFNSFCYFAVFFAIGDAVSYLSKYDLLSTKFSYTQFLWPFLSCIAIGFFFSIFRYYSKPYFTNAMLILNGIVFGISYKSELIDESIKYQSKAKSKSKSKFDRSLSDNFYYLIVTLFVIFPIEYFLIKLLSKYIILQVLLYIVLFVIWYFLSSLLSKKNILNIEIEEDNNIQTSILVIILCVISLFGLVVWDITALSNSLVEDSLLQKILYLFFMGIIPIRVVPVFYSKTSLAVRLLNIASLIYYLIIKLYYFNWSWF